MILPNWFELRAGMIVGFALACFFTLPLLITALSTAGSVTGSVRFDGQESDISRIGDIPFPGMLIMVLGPAAMGVVFGCMSRRMTQLILLGASNPSAPDRLKKRRSIGRVGRFIYRLNEDGTDA